MDEYKYRSLLPRQKTNKERLTEFIIQNIPLLVYLGMGILVLGFLLYCQQSVAFGHEVGLI